MKNLHYIGITHKDVPIEVRERFGLSASQVSSLLRRLKRSAALHEICLLSTCNRFECYYSTTVPKQALKELHAVFSKVSGVALKRLPRLAKRLQGEEPVSHLFRVAAGCDSMVVGEPQILGQVKEAYGLADKAGTLGPLLRVLFECSFRAGKKTRTETAIGEKPVSVVCVAVELARRIFGEMHEACLLVVGAGDTALETLDRLRREGVRSITVANRTLSRARALAKKVRGSAVAFNKVGAALAKADVVITSTSSPHPVFRRKLVSEAMKERKGKPLFIIDIAVPRDVEPQAGELEGVFLYNIDDLKGQAESNRQERTEAVAEAEGIIHAELAAFKRWVASRQVAPSIIRLRAKLMAMGDEELKDYFGVIGDEKERKRIREYTRRLIERLLHEPSVALKKMGNKQGGLQEVEAVRKLFGLDD